MSSILDKLLKGQSFEWKTLGEVSEFKYGKGNTIPTNGGKYPVYGCNGIVGTHDQFNNENSPIIGHIGTAGIVVWGEGKHFVTYNGTICNPKKDILLSKYVYHYLLTLRLTELTKGSQPFLSYDTLKKICIPIPPLEIQAKIVKILDAFTALTAELTAELTMREKQYHYYRDNLLTFSDDVEWKTLAELGTLIRGNGMQKKDFTETGFPAIHYGQIYTHFGTFANTTKSYVSDELAKKLRKAHKGDVLLAGTSENIQDVMKPLGWLGDEVAISGDMFAYRPNNDLDTKYLTYLLQTTEFQKYKEKYAQGAKVTRLNTEKFLNFNVPVPSLKEQKRIANILDKFEVLTISLTEGLPREIALRQQQYEYYREQLLDFPQ